jgi:hypothetical protein
MSFTTHGQSKIKTKDSLDMKTQVEGFYSWYIDVVKSGKFDSAFSPIFIKREDGFTTLDFTQYSDRLRKYRFTEDFIQRKVSEYKGCVDTLNKIPFDEFSKLKDLDEFERINCDFGNRYEWTGGQEMKDKAELINLKRVGSKAIVGQVSFFSYNSSDGTAKVTFKKLSNAWCIDNIKLE